MNILKTFVLTVPIGITIVDTLGYVARVEGESMKPTLNPTKNSDSDYVFLCKANFLAKNVSRGTIVSLISPKDPQQRIIKRVVGLQGDTISTTGNYRHKFVRIPEGHVWIEGDYVANSLDSNTFGSVPLGLLTARASHIIWPPSRWGTLQSEPTRDPIKFGKRVLKS